MGSDIPEKSFVRVFRVLPERLFTILADVLKQSNPFKVWKVDEKARLIDMTTYLPLLGVTSHRERVDVSVLDGKDGNSFVVQIRVSPATTPSQFTMVDFFSKKGMVESGAGSIARTILKT
ncbi:MAG: hypothetical protein ACREAY_07465 [Nitrososphaera sp.]|uniref:hypothetical protein n=1 Tax=Nitrososphaera sp. TaxID=1971748 RepID=UPI003D6DB74E